VSCARIAFVRKKTAPALICINVARPNGSEQCAAGGEWPMLVVAARAAIIETSKAIHSVRHGSQA
jgi:hypothetical protein